MSEANQGPGGAKGRARTVSAWGFILSPSGIRGQTGRFGLVVFSSGVMRESPQLPPPPAHGPFSGGRGGPGMWRVKFQGSPPNLGQGRIASLLGNSLQKWVLKQHLPRQRTEGGWSLWDQVPHTQEVNGLCGEPLRHRHPPSQS